jgi:hypothetical protein
MRLNEKFSRADSQNSENFDTRSVILSRPFSRIWGFHLMNGILTQIEYELTTVHDFLSLCKSKMIPSRCLPALSFLYKQIKTTRSSGTFELTPFYTPG